MTGGCSNDVLVLRLKDTKTHNILFYGAYLKRPQFFEYIMQDIHGLKMPRGNKAHIMRYSVDKKTQDETVIKIRAIEEQIKFAEQKLNSLTGKTSEILNKYLNLGEQT